MHLTCTPQKMKKDQIIFLIQERSTNSDSGYFLTLLYFKNPAALQHILLVTCKGGGFIRQTRVQEQTGLPLIYPHLVTAL